MKEKWVLLGGILLYCCVIRYMFHIVWPFLLSCLCFFIMKPFLDYMQQHFHIHRKLGSFLMLIALYLIIITIIGVLLMICVIAGIRIYHYLPHFVDLITDWNMTMYKSPVIMYMQNHSSQWIDMIFNELTLFFSSLPRFFFSFGLFLLASFFLFLEYDVIKDKISKCMSQKYISYFIDMKNKSIMSMKMYMKCQIILMIICFLLLWIGFVVLSIPYSFLLAIGICILDTLPFVGIGIGLFPVMTFFYMQGMYLKVIYLILLYLFIGFIRSLLEPHIMNKQLKIPSFILLLSMIIHIYLFGVVGVLLSPIHINILYSLIKDYKI